MKRCDLHIHTVASVSDSPFIFDLDVLRDYVKSNGLEVIAITNHNLFDFNQFAVIKEGLPDVAVLPGIEVDLEKGHILVITNNDDSSLFDFNAKCGEISSRIHTQTDFITFETFSRIFQDYTKYLFIPHYDKSPALPKAIIEKLGRSIVAGEVSSVKKFVYLEKEAEAVTPVYFSDFRAARGIFPGDYPVSHTFMDIEEVSVKSLKLCLMDKTKVSLNSEKGSRLFQVFPNGQMLSTGLNIMFGKRSTGKTYTLDAIAKKYGEKAKYIKQFELLNTSRNDSEQFENDLKIRQERYAENFFKEFSRVVEDMLELTSQEEDESNLNKYIDSLKTAATQSDMNDVFSKAALFNESEYNDQNSDEITRLINAVETLLDTQQYKAVVSSYLLESALIGLLRELIEIYRTHELERRYHQEVNNMIKLAKESLQLKSAAPRIPNIDLYQFFINKKKREVFAQIVIAVKKDRIISEEKAGQFTIRVQARPFTNATDLKSVVQRQMPLAGAFEKYKNPIQYLAALKVAGVDSDRIYKLFAAIDYKIMNSSGLPVSGGERSEFNFLQKIKDAILSEILIIDEPESSFDNIFLKNEVNRFIKDMAERMPVIISTHNNTIGGSIKPDYVLYTEKRIENGEPLFSIYSGFPGSKELKDVSGNSIKNYTITLDSLEAGEEAYTERRGIYETLKN